MRAGVRPELQTPLGLPQVDRSVRFRLTSAILPVLRNAQTPLAPEPRLTALNAMSPRSRRKLKPYRASKEVKRQARLHVGSPPPTRKEELPKKDSQKHKKRELEYDWE